MLVAQGTFSDAATHQVDEEGNVVANSNAVDCTAAFNDLSSASGFWKRMGSRKTEKLSYKNPKVKLPVKHIAVKLKL